MHVWTIVSTYRYLYIQTRQCTRYTNASCCVSNSHFLEFRIRWDSIQWYLSPLNSRRVTFSLLLSSLNISSISCLQSSCMVWKLSWGVVIKGEVDISSSRRRISAKVGLWWDSWCQQSEKVTENAVLYLHCISKSCLIKYRCQIYTVINKNILSTIFLILIYYTSIYCLAL